MLRRTALALGLALLTPQTAAGVEEAAEAEPPPSWRFRRAQKPVKVIVLAGSIGAYRRDPYAKRLEGMCANIEVKNLSKTGLGAYALKKRFREQVLENRYLRWNVEGQEYWLVFGGGLNSVGMPTSTNHYIRRLFEQAHRRGMSVVGMTVLPWGDDKDKRWRTAEGGLKYRRLTQQVVDFMMKRLTPQQALGRYANKRKVEADAPWEPTELPDIAVDLYDSVLRDREAPLRDVAKMREALEKSKTWQRAHRDLDEVERQAALQSDAQQAAEVPRWYMRQELRAFDHIHPNTKGHRLVAEAMCPVMPASWGCSCPSAESGTP